MPTRVLAFMAHPDDVEINCAGTLIRLQQEAGCEIAIATATSGDCGTMVERPDEIARIRNQEARNAAAVIGAEYHAGRSRDLFVMYDEPTLRRFIEILRLTKPDIVITHAPADYMIDHENTSRLVRTACFAAPAPNCMTHAANPATRCEHVPALYYADPVELKDPMGTPSTPDFVVDVSTVMETKVKMLACHASQREWLRAHHNMDEYIEMMKRTGEERGKLINKRYGEGFRQHLGHAYPQENVIGKLLGMSTA